MEVAGTQVDPATLFTPREQCHEMRWKGRIFIRHLSAISHASPPWWWKRYYGTNARRSVLLLERALPPAYQWITYVRIHWYSLWMNVCSRMAWCTTGEEQSKPNFSTQTKPQNFDQSTCGNQQSVCFLPLFLLPILIALGQSLAATSMLAVQISTSLTGKVMAIEWSSSSQASVGSKKCPQRETMQIWCIDYLLIYWLWKLWEQMYGYFACFCAVVWCETTPSDLSFWEEMCGWERERSEQLRVIWHWEEMCGWERKDRDLADTYSDLNFLLFLVRWSSCEITQGKLEVERERYWDLIFRLVR